MFDTDNLNVLEKGGNIKGISTSLQVNWKN